MGFEQVFRNYVAADVNDAPLALPTMGVAGSPLVGSRIKNTETYINFGIGHNFTEDINLALVYQLVDFGKYVSMSPTNRRTTAVISPALRWVSASKRAPSRKRPGPASPAPGGRFLLNLSRRAASLKGRDPFARLNRGPPSDPLLMATRALFAFEVTNKA